jgi:hypothetical protein
MKVWTGFANPVQRRFLSVCAEINNPNFNLTKFHKIKNQAGSNGFIAYLQRN